MKEKIAKWYKQGLWTAQMVQNAVKKGVLTADEAAEILSADTEANVINLFCRRRTDSMIHER